MITANNGNTRFELYSSEEVISKLNKGCSSNTYLIRRINDKVLDIWIPVELIDILVKQKIKEITSKIVDRIMK